MWYWLRVPNEHLKFVNRFLCYDSIFLFIVHYAQVISRLQFMDTCCISKEEYKYQSFSM